MILNNEIKKGGNFESALSSESGTVAKKLMGSDLTTTLAELDQEVLEGIAKNFGRSKKNTVGYLNEGIVEMSKVTKNDVEEPSVSVKKNKKPAYKS